MADERTTIGELTDLAQNLGTWRSVVILWTAVVGAALIGCQKEALQFAWPYIYWPWVGLLATWMIVSGVATIARTYGWIESKLPALKPEKKV